MRSHLDMPEDQRSSLRGRGPAASSASPPSRSRPGPPAERPLDLDQRILEWILLEVEK